MMVNSMKGEIIIYVYIAICMHNGMYCMITSGYSILPITYDYLGNMIA